MKGLEALNNLVSHINEVAWQEVFEPLVNENKSIIEKELKAHNLIVKKNVNIHRLLTYSFEDYNLSVVKDWELTYAEYKFLREVLKDEA